MKKLIIVNGTMGVGKSATCDKLYRSLEKSCWLDGDWCWTMNPFSITDQNKEMVLENIAFLLNNFLKNNSFEYVIFNWVMHEEIIINLVLDQLDIQSDIEVFKFSLFCNEEELTRRIMKDKALGKRDGESLTRSIERLKMYHDMDTIKIDVSDISLEETVRMIKNYLNSVD